MKESSPSFCIRGRGSPCAKHVGGSQGQVGRTGAMLILVLENKRGESGGHPFSLGSP